MCGVKLCAPFHPQSASDLSQNNCSCSRNPSVGQTYRMYSRGDVSSSSGSFTCASNQSDASWTPRLPVAAKAFSLKIEEEAELYYCRKQMNLADTWSDHNILKKVKLKSFKIHSEKVPSSKGRNLLKSKIISNIQMPLIYYILSLFNKWFILLKCLILKKLL